MRENKYKILVLSNLKEETSIIIKNTVSLAKMIGADIEFFYVKKPIEVVDTESQLSAMRTISKAHIDTEKEINSLTDTCTKTYDIKIESSFVFGNVKTEISKHIKTQQPDVIVLGKRKPKTISFIGDNITDYVLDVFDGPVMISSDTHAIEPGKNPSVGFFNVENQTSDLRFTKELIGDSELPLRSFHIVSKLDELKQNKTDSNDRNIKYVFEKNDNAYKTISNYLIKNKVDLLCLDRNGLGKEYQGVSTKIKDVVDKVNVSLFLTNKAESISV